MDPIGQWILRVGAANFRSTEKGTEVGGKVEMGCGAPRRRLTVRIVCYYFSSNVGLGALDLQYWSRNAIKGKKILQVKKQKTFQ